MPGALDPLVPATEASLRREVEALRRLLGISRDLSSILDPEVLCEAILDAAIRLTGAQRGFLLSPDAGGVRIHLGRGHGGNSLDREMSRVSRTLVLECLEQNRVLPHDNLRAAADLGAVQSIRALSLYSAVCVPVREAGQPKGVLYLDSSVPGLHSTQWEIALLEAFASHASVALANARRLREAEEARLALRRENEELRAEMGAVSGFGALLGRSEAMRVLFERMRLLKDTRIPVLLSGESGTGKELAARALHYEGLFRDGPFVPVNCAGLPADLLDSLMFGHRRGAFTGAVQDMPGLVEQANGGTLFLDEIGNMPLALQVKLLRFLESGEFRRVGEVDLRTVQARVLSATNRDLEGMVRDGIFREDLYFRLGGIRLRLPPLRERKEDILLLIDHFLARLAAERPAIASLGAGARAWLMAQPWPGNVRQLRHVLEGVCVLVPQGVIEEEHLRVLLEPAAAGPGRGEALGTEGKGASFRCARPGEIERTAVSSALDRQGWNISRAAGELGMTRQQVYRRIRRYGLSRR